MQKNDFQDKFYVGCNYWASHAGTNMWREWDETIVRKDLSDLYEYGVRVIRVFPLWSDFQPVKMLYGELGKPCEIRMGETALGNDEFGKAGVSAEMMDHFRKLADFAEELGIKLIVGLVTGWMSGRLYVPPAFDGRNVITDPLVRMWQIRFVRCFVKHFKYHPAIVAWDLGNECNCMQIIEKREQAWEWTSSIVTAIKTEDFERQVVSGMHSLTPEGVWRIQDQGELTDVLTTHPYPVFTPYCNMDAVDEMRPFLHSVSESLFYEDIGGKPCLAEELGTLGPMIASDEIAGKFIRGSLFSNWANDLSGMLWWCAYDQNRLTHAPYDWSACERELGLFRADRTSKPVLLSLKKFSQWLEQQPVQKLPPVYKDVVCILTKGQDQWACAYSAFILAKQAGVNLQYRFAGQPLPDASLYLIPSIKGYTVMDEHDTASLMEKVKKGAALYVSTDGGYFSDFIHRTGVKIQRRFERESTKQVRFDGIEKGLSLTMNQSIGLELEAVQADILARDPDGNPAMTRFSYGEGNVIFLKYPLERMLANMPGVFSEENTEKYWKVYEYLKKFLKEERVVVHKNEYFDVTEHKLTEKQYVVTAINCTSKSKKPELSLSDGWKISEVWYGEKEDPLDTEVESLDALIFVVEFEGRTKE